MKPSLFRAEVLQERRAHWLGVIDLPHRRLGTGFALLAAGLGLLLCLFVAFGDYTRKARLSGVVVPRGGLIQVQAPHPASAVEYLVHEGQAVQAGQALVRLRTERVIGGGELTALQAQTLSQRRAALQTESTLAEQGARQRSDALHERLRSLQSEERHLQAESDTLDLRVNLAERSHQRQIELARSGFVSSAQVQQKQEERLELELRQQHVQRQRHALQRDMEALRADLQQHQHALQNQLMQIERQRLAVDQDGLDNESRSAVLITAQQAGRVAAVALSNGQPVLAGQWLLSLIPSSLTPNEGEPQPPREETASLEVQLLAPSKAAGLIEAGQTVWLRYAAFPHQKYGTGRGLVQSVGLAPLSNIEPAARVATEETVYRVTVALPRDTLAAHGQSVRLKPGMTVQADVMQDRRRLWEWMLEPLLAAPAEFGRDAIAMVQGAVP